MKLGLLTAAFPELSLEEVAAWAAANGFENSGANRAPSVENASIHDGAKPSTARTPSSLWALPWGRSSPLETLLP